MKRIFITLIAAIAFAAGAMAEQDNRVATCQHGSTIRAYYGADAFKSAHADAADGDIITLTAGTFNGCDITKAVTIRGEGYGKTFITSVGNYNIPKGSEHVLYLESLCVQGGGSFNGSDGSEKVVISKCEIKGDYLSFTKCNATVMQSILNNTNYYHKVNAGEYATVTCLNSIIYDSPTTSYSASCTSEQNGHWYISNCAIYNTVSGLRCSTIKNSTFRVACSIEEGTNTSSHCLVPEGSTGFFNSYYVKPEADPWDENDLAWNNLFDGTGGWWNMINESAKATYLGTDGTQVGVFGGTYPWNQTPDLPSVKWLDVTESYKNGKLNVQINVE